MKTGLKQFLITLGILVLIGILIVLFNRQAIIIKNNYFVTQQPNKNISNNLPACRQTYGEDSRNWNNCVGKKIYPNRNIYVGEFRNGVREGKGQILIVDLGQSTNNAIRSDRTAKYIGQFKNDRINGHGTWIYDNGEKFEGDFVNNILVKKY
jgi:hypothetical protein